MKFPSFPDSKLIQHTYHNSTSQHSSTKDECRNDLYHLHYLSPKLSVSSRGLWVFVGLSVCSIGSALLLALTDHGPAWPVYALSLGIIIWCSVLIMRLATLQVKENEQVQLQQIALERIALESQIDENKHSLAMRRIDSKEAAQEAEQLNFFIDADAS